jgi:hypothetical protein
LNEDGDKFNFYPSNFWREHLHWRLFE